MIHLISPNEREMLRDAGDRMPLGNLYLAAALDAHDLENRVVDLNHEDPESVISEIKQDDIVCMSVMTPTAEQAKQFLGRVSNKHFVQMFAGGPHVTNKPRDMPNEVFEVPGHGEPKLVYMLAGKYELFDIDRYPIPARHKLDKTRYNFSLEGIPATTMITGRGCANACVFCSNTDKTPKRRNLSNIVTELDQIKAEYGAVYLVDDSFLADPHDAMKVMTQLGMRGLKYRVEARADDVNQYTADLLGATGCLVAALGIESGNSEVLRRTGKRETKEDIRKAVRYLGNSGVKTKGFFIIGLPGETESTARETIQFADELRDEGLAYADFYPLMPYPGSKIYYSPAKFGIEVKDKDTSHYLNGGVDLKVPCATKDLSRAKTKHLIMDARDKWRK